MTTQSKAARLRTPGRRDSSRKGYRLDDLERKIIAELQDDGRKPFQSIARTLGVDEKTVRNRVAKLRENGVLSIIPVTHSNKLRECIVALIGITISPEGRADPEAVVEQIAQLPMVSWVGTIMGRFDLIAEIVVDSREALGEFQLHILPAIHGVGLTEGFLVMTHHGKRGVPFVPLLVETE